MAVDVSGDLQIVNETSITISQFLEKAISWDYESCKLRFFRVEGSCKVSTPPFTPPVTCPPPASECSPGVPCPSNFVANVLACDVCDVLRKLKSRGFVRTVHKIQEFCVQNTPGDPSASLKDVTPESPQEVCEEFSEFFVDEIVDLGTLCPQDSAAVVFLAEIGGSLVVQRGQTGLHVAKGTMTIESEFTFISPYYLFEIGGSMSVDSDTSVVPHYHYTAEGDIDVDLMMGLGRDFPVGGSMGIGSGFTPQLRFVVAMEGALSLTSDFGIISPSYTYVVGGMMKLVSVSETQSSDLGTIDMDAEFAVEVENEDGIFSPIPAPAINVAPLQEVIVSSCCPAALPTILELKHNLNGLTSLMNFLHRNDLRLPGALTRGRSPDFVPLEFSRRTKTWQGNLHFAGQSIYGAGLASWSIVFEFGCVDDLGMTHLSEAGWKFSMSLINREPTSRFTSRLLIGFNAAAVCPDARTFDEFDFTFNTATLLVVPNDVSSVAFSDNDYMFASSAGFIRNPLLDVRIVAHKAGRTSRFFEHPWERQLRTTELLPAGDT